MLSSSLTCVKLHGTIHYLFSHICCCFSVRAPAALLRVIRRSASTPSLLRPTSSAGLRLTHLLVLVRELWIFFSSPFTQWQRGEMLWGLGANELTLQCWGRCSGTQGGDRGWRRQRSSGTWSQRGHYDHATQGVRQTGLVTHTHTHTHSCNVAPESAARPNCAHHLPWHPRRAISTLLHPVCFCWFEETAAKETAARWKDVRSATNQNAIHAPVAPWDVNIYPPNRAHHKWGMEKKRGVWR